MLCRVCAALSGGQVIERRVELAIEATSTLWCPCLRGAKKGLSATTDSDCLPSVLAAEVGSKGELEMVLRLVRISLPGSASLGDLRAVGGHA